MNSRARRAPILLPMARPRALPLVFALVLSAGGLLAQAPAPNRPAPIRVNGFEQTQNWLALARTHRMGDLDDVARTVASWPPASTSRMLEDLQLIRLLIALSNGPARSGISADHSGRRLTWDQLAPLLGVDPQALPAPFVPSELAAPGSPARRAIAQLMIQVAMLHTDIAMATNDLALQASNRAQATAIQLRDGRQLVVSNLSVHWAIAREAVAMVLSATVGQSVARQWYHASVAYMQAERNYAALAPHLQTARALLPADSWLWLQSGAAYENLAAPAVQVAVAESGGSAKVDEPTILLARAEIMLRRALELDPDRNEARLRLGRVLDLIGRHQEAAAMLAAAEKQLTNPALRYYAALFGGHAVGAISQAEDARRAYERAMALFPRAQSPRLALAEMAWRDGSPGLAQSGLRTLFVTAGGDRSTDPWWVYDVSLVTDWADRVLDMRRAAVEAGSR
jgi:tetratricopeptide (TPR) repeat protein